MALFATQLQPWEEHQSPSPTEEHENPYELALARSRSSSKSGHGPKHDSKPPSPVNTLHRQLSGDQDAPPPAWKRRSSVNSRSPSSSSNHHNNNGPPSASRRHPGLQMSLSSPHGQPLPDAGPLHESPDNDNSPPDLAELGLPQPAFRRRSNASSGRSSNRSSSHSLSGMGLTGEELWQLDHPDASNPDRPSRERPLDTARRMSRNYDKAQPWQGGLPGEVIWPAALEPEAAPPPIKSKSTLSLASVGGQKKRITIRKKGSRNQSFVDAPTNDGVYLHGSTVSPNSLSRPDSMILSSSAQSSTTSLNSQGFSPVKVAPNLSGNRPPSAYYSRDFLSSLAPREGGYAIAATMGNGLGAHGTMSVDERRKSQYDPSLRRAPVSKSAGMGRWSLDGGEHYGARPYGTPSAATTASNLSAPPINSPETSPPLEEVRLPEGASPPPSAINTTPRAEQADVTSPTSTSAPTPTITIPVNPSPLSQGTHANDMATPKSERGPSVPAPAPVPVSAPSTQDTPTSTLSVKKSKKDLAKEAKADAQRQKVEEHKRKAEAKAAALKAKADKKEAEAKAKQEVKRKEKEEKERLKAEKQAKKSGRSSSFASLPAGSASRKESNAPPVPPLPAGHTGTTTNSASAPTKSAPVPFPRTNSVTSPTPKPAQPARQTATSMPLEKSITAPSPSQRAAQTSTPTSTLKEKKSRLGFFGTLKKRFSSGPSSGQPDVRMRQASDAANLSSMPSKAAATPIAEANSNSNSSNAASSAPAPVASSTSINGTPVLAATPPRSHSLAPSPPPGGADPTPMSQSTAPAVDRAPPTSFTTPGPPAPIVKAVSREPSVKSGRSNSMSVRGPRPMPVQSSPVRDRDAEHQSRPTSLITTPSTEAAPVTPAVGFPFTTKSPLNLGPEIVTPSTTGTGTGTETDLEPSIIDSSVFSHAAPGQSDASSPFTSVGSRASSLATDEKPQVPAISAIGHGQTHLPANERGESTTSKSSEETVQPQPVNAI